MATPWKRILKPGQTWQTITSIRTLTSSCSATRGDYQNRSYHRPLEDKTLVSKSECWSSKSRPTFPGIFPIISAVLAGLLGVGTLSFADAEGADTQTPPLPKSPPHLPESPLPLPKSPPPLPESPPPFPESPPSEYVDVEKFVKQERKRLEDLLKKKGILTGSYPPFRVAMKGQKVSIKFQIPRTCEIPQLIVDLASHLGLKSEQRGGSSDVILRTWNSAVAWQLTFHHPEKQKEDPGDRVLGENKNDHNENFCVILFQSLISSDDAEIEFLKQGSFSPEELDALVSALKLAGAKMVRRTPLQKRPSLDTRANIPEAQKSLAALEAMGVRVFGINENHEGSSEGEISWDNIAGYDQQKREIEDTILLALRSPKIYDDIARGTRRKFESNRPRAVLFEGPPGTGKTSCARVIANQAGVPLVYVPLEAVMSKYYGESERLFGKVFSLANGLPDGAIIFLDEIDSFAASRDDGMHEATRRILSVLLRQIDGFEQDKKVVVIAATNRKGDLDSALISRFDSMITFSLPDQQNRKEIAAQYAKHLNSSELVEFAAFTEEMSGRDIRDVCQQAERHWASKVFI
ncbi:hypothetical protein AQUCO_03200059v1 [Aquilegia coerulea]|uniref:AAA+ ATPase domain-containing protein n=1 Tax=Aquilegia coerulea TaxID=218851 RepID=A0A2G5CZX2_AQUCA|nr:hypothetical protein AQUCO_03200059v1 [Aquilegia coerulea]